MGLTVSVYRCGVPGRDCTNHGISSQARDLCLVNVEGPFGPSDETPAAMLVDHRPFGDDIGRRLVRVVPAEMVDGEWRPLKRPSSNGPMFGGNYAGCSDSRLREAIEEHLGVFFYGAVPIHDRFE